MKLLDALLLYPAFALVIIGLHQILMNGFANSYWILMLALMLLFGYQFRKTKQEAAQKDNKPTPAKPAARRKKP
jgi:hypothetical protein